MLEKTKLKSVMKSPVVCVYEDDELSVVEEAFVQNRIYYLPVISHEQQLVGLVSSKYLYKTQSPRRMMDHSDIERQQYNPDSIVDGESFYSKETLDSFILRNMMQKDPLTLKETDTLSKAVELMDVMNAGCIIIIDDHRQVRGLFSSQEIVHFLSRL